MNALLAVIGMTFYPTKPHSMFSQRNRIVRMGAKAQAFHPTTESFRAMVKAAEQRVAEQAEKKKAAERDWIAAHYPKAAQPPAANSDSAGGAVRVRYRGTAVRYMGAVIGRDGPPLNAVAFGSTDSAAPGFVDQPQVFTFEPGKTKINGGLERTIASMKPGERQTVIVPADQAYGRAGFYAPEVTGKRRFVISSNTMLAYEVEVLANE